MIQDFLMRYIQLAQYANVSSENHEQKIGTKYLSKKVLFAQLKLTPIKTSVTLCLYLGTFENSRYFSIESH